MMHLMEGIEHDARIQLSFSSLIVGPIMCC